MTPKTTRFKKEDRSATIDYFKKAEDNHKAMLAAFTARHFNAAGTLALQCAISSADALCVYFKGFRSVSKDDLDICELIATIPLPEAKDKSGLLRQIIGKKEPHPIRTPEHLGERVRGVGKGRVPVLPMGLLPGPAGLRIS